jgi:hypothetical protein
MPSEDLKVPFSWAEWLVSQELVSSGLGATSGLRKMKLVERLPLALARNKHVDAHGAWDLRASPQITGNGHNKNAN